MRQLFTMLLVVIVTTGAYAQQLQQAHEVTLPGYHLHGEGLPQDYGQDALAKFTITWVDTMFVFNLAADPDVLEVTSIEFIDEEACSAKSFKAPVKIPAAYMHNLYIKTKMGITSISFQGFKEVDARTVLINGKTAYILFSSDHSIVSFLEDKGMDAEAFKDSNWEWYPIYDRWVARQRDGNSSSITMKKKNLSY